MHIVDANRWIVSEIRDSKVFTFLNIVSVAVNVFLVLVFLALITGFETEYISRITRNYNLFTLGVQQRNDRLDPIQLQYLANDPNVRQVVPILSRYVELHRGKQKVVNVLSESFWTKDSLQTDLRGENLIYVAGGPIKVGDEQAIILTESDYNTLFEQPFSELVKAREPLSVRVVATVEQNGVKTSKAFGATVQGVVESTLYGGRLTFLSVSLAQDIDTWTSTIYGREPSVRSGLYDRVDLVISDLDSLKRLRENVERNGLATTSILDEIDSVNVVLRIIQIVVLGIVVVSGVIAFFNLAITLASYVMKRHQEIGVLKAMGATNSQVQRIFLLHAIYLCVSGCVVGTTVAGVFLWVLQVTILQTLKVERVQAFQIHPNHILTILIVAIIFGIASVFLPARRANAISPAEIIRSA